MPSEQEIIESLKGRVREIVEGRAGVSLDYTNAVRARYGLPPMAEADRPAERVGMTVSVVAADPNNPTPKPEPQRMRGAGDLVAYGIKKVTGGRVKPCGGCNKRIDWLNKVIPFKGGDK